MAADGTALNQDDLSPAERGGASKITRENKFQIRPEGSPSPDVHCSRLPKHVFVLKLCSLDRTLHQGRQNEFDPDAPVASHEEDNGVLFDKVTVLDGCK
jgi:hypothetical protein